MPLTEMEMFYVIVAIAVLIFLYVCGCELYESQRNAEHTPVLVLCVDTYDVGSLSVPVNSVSDAQALVNLCIFSLVKEARVIDTVNNKLIAYMDDNGVLV